MLDLSSSNEIIWLPVIGYEGLYEVSSEGRVRSLNYRGTKGKVEEINQELCKGYLQVKLYREKVRQGEYVHRLVSKAFIPNPDSLPQVNHIDEDKTNNQVSNLEWCSVKDNSNHGTRNQRRSAKLLNGALSKSVIAIDPVTGEVKHTFPSVMEAEREGFVRSNIRSCCRGVRKTHRGLHWKYEESNQEAVEELFGGSDIEF